MRVQSGERSSPGMARRIREFDWAKTAIGALEAWPAGLRAAADVMLGCGFPSVLWAGRDAVMLYNDAYAVLLHGRDDLGRRGLGALAAAEATLGPALDGAWQGETVTLEDHFLPLRRAGAGEEGCFTLSCSPVRDDAGEVAGALLIMIEAPERSRIGRRPDLLAAELQHRVRNILAVIRSIVGRTAETSETVEQMSAHLDGRLSALARTQTILTRSPGAGVDLERLVRDELLAQAADDERVAIQGPEVLLPSKAAEVMTLAIHELATNATKYGALSSDTARLEIIWRVVARDEVDWLEFQWRESGVKIAATAPRRAGFGSVLVEQAIPYELRGAGVISFVPGGVRCEITFPLTTTPSAPRAETD